MLYERFNDEAEFRTKFVRPLLTRLGFVSVAELHGSQEFGKDFVFSELTPFGFLRHYAAVVKHEETIRQSSCSVCNTVLSQVRQAFTVDFQLPDNHTVNHVSSVVVFNSGKITPNAKQLLRSELDEERYGRNVHIFDAERLSQLDLSCGFRQGEQFLPRLEGIRYDLRLNLAVWQSILKGLPSFGEGRGYFTTALENFLAAPFLTDRISVDEISFLVQECRIIECVNKRYLAIMPKDELREQEVDRLRSVIPISIARANRIMAEIDRVLDSFKLLTDTKT